MIVLAIETSCDETSAAVVEGNKLLSNVVWSQIKDHFRWGGVVPSIARRAHEDRLPEIVSRVLNDSRLTIGEINAIAVTVGPGLAPALEAGIEFAKKLALEQKKPLIPVNHLEGHIASLFLQRKSCQPFINNFEPFNLFNLSDHFLSLIVSGGHTELVSSNLKSQNSKLIMQHFLIGHTLDDAAGECIDKIGRELGLGYPAGPVLERFAKDGDPEKYKLPVPMERSPRENLNFSFSGLKTAAIQTLYKSHSISKVSLRQTKELSKQEICNFCASFQKTVIDALLLKLKRAMTATGLKTVFLTGGVSANNQLRRRAGALVRSSGGRFYAAPKKFSGDNAAMIGMAAQFSFNRGEVARSLNEIAAIDRQPGLNFPS
ncbi:tRNA (adenosine(37)-N6)-threonylcarbamoyltransferase complex transferase subunit TsaD [Candidatus Collierbacteria bacterium]|nr:tRNA (adenosine(37)-N6)-threonylcarbamoyltransferase complex transferase subunit TsaD [Candidatus Collierbacteria bacterium]